MELVKVEVKERSLEELTNEYIFWKEARLGLDLNLRLAYLLVHAQRLTLSEATRALKTSKPLVLNVLAENPLFSSELRRIERWGGGGRERLMILSDEGKARTALLEAVAQAILGLVECQRLRAEAGIRRRKGLKEEEGRAKRLDKDLVNLRRLKNRPVDKPGPSYPLALKVLARKHQMSPEELEARI